MQPKVSKHTKERLVRFQSDEMTGAALYDRIADRTKDKDNKKTLRIFAQQEREHAAFWQSYTGEESKVNKVKLFFYTLFTFILGFTFSVKLLERNEDFTVQEYEEIKKEIPDAQRIIEEEQEHEDALMSMLDEERLQYIGSMVLGLNDALVELTGAIAGLTFALTNTRLVALSGIITGISATLSMAASNYLAEKADGNPNAMTSSIYTGVAYLVTVVLMVLPYLLFPNEMYLAAFVVMISTVVIIIFVFNFYISVARSQPFFKNFATMALISLSVAAISFVIGLLAKRLLGIDI